MRSGRGVLFRFLTIIAVLSCLVLGQSRIEIPEGLPEEVSRGKSYYEGILEKKPGLPEAHFGAGHSAYSIENFERAQKEFEAASKSERSDLQAKSHYNLGNTLHRQGRLEESLLAFRDAIQLDPSDVDAKYNYELTQRMLQQMQNQQSEPQQSEGDEDQENEDQEQERQQQPQPPLDQDQQNQDQPRQDQQQQEQPQQDKPNAEAILDALKADDENLMKRKLGHARSKKRLKDW